MDTWGPVHEALEGSNDFIRNRGYSYGILAKDLAEYVEAEEAVVIAKDIVTAGERCPRLH